MPPTRPLEAHDYMTEMIMRTGIETDDHALVAGAIRESRYDYHAMKVVRQVVMRSRRNDPEVNEHELTDRDTFGTKIGTFLTAAKRAKRRPVFCHSGYFNRQGVDFHPEVTRVAA